MDNQFEHDSHASPGKHEKASQNYSDLKKLMEELDLPAEEQPEHKNISVDALIDRAIEASGEEEPVPEQEPELPKPKHREIKSAQAAEQRIQADENMQAEEPELDLIVEAAELPEAVKITEDTEADDRGDSSHREENAAAEEKPAEPDDASLTEEEKEERARELLANGPAQRRAKSEAGKKQNPAPKQRSSNTARKKTTTIRRKKTSGAGNRSARPAAAGAARPVKRTHKKSSGTARRTRSAAAEQAAVSRHTQVRKKKQGRRNSQAAKARRRKVRMMRMGLVAIAVVILLLLLSSCVKKITGHGGKGKDMGSGSSTAASMSAEEARLLRQKEGPASQQETQQYLDIKDDDDLPSYAKEYPGMYSDAIRVENKLSDEKVCYLTFDDGPSSTNTPGILDVLKKEKVKATFFVVASSVTEKTEPILQRIVDEGHTLCIHCNEHEYDKIYQSTAGYLKDFAQAYDKIYEVTGYRVQGFRFPGGSNGRVNSSGCYDNIVKEMTRRGFEYYDWNAYDHDAEGGDYSVQDMVNYAVHEVEVSSRKDVIMLLHDTYGKEKTVQALPGIIRELKSQDIKLLPITASTRPVHFEVSSSTPPEYNEDAQEDQASSKDKTEESDED